MNSSNNPPDPSNAVSPSRPVLPQTIMLSTKEDWIPYDVLSREKRKDEEEVKGLFCVKWSPPIDRFFDFVTYFRTRAQTKLGGSRKPKHEYQDTTIARVMSVGSEDPLSCLPQRVTLSNFKLGAPITSYGCICRYQKNTGDKSDHLNGSVVEPQYLLIKRTSSTSYIDLIRGTYRDSQLFFMIQDLSDEERTRLTQHPFDDLWEDLHLKPADSSCEAYLIGRNKFQQVKDILPSLFEKFPSRDPEGRYLWLFPKGKPEYRPLSSYNFETTQTIIPSSPIRSEDGERLIPESPFESALREFTEETNGLTLDESQLRMENPVIEKYLGSNSKNYQSTYFVFQTDELLPIEPFPQAETKIRKVSLGEAGEIRWMKYSEREKYLCPARQKLLEYIEQHLPEKQPESVYEIWKRPAELAEFQVE